MIAIILPSAVYVRSPEGFWPSTALFTSPLSVVAVFEISFQVPTTLSLHCAFAVDEKARKIAARIRYLPNLSGIAALVPTSPVGTDSASTSIRRVPTTLAFQRLTGERTHFPRC